MNAPEAIPHHPEADAFDVRASLRRIMDACLGHKLLIALTCIFTIAIVVTYIVVWPPIYQAKVMLLAEPADDRMRDEFYQVWSIFRKDIVETEVQLMMSTAVLETVVTKLGLTYDDVHHPFLRYAGHLWVESWVGKKYRKVKHFFFPPKKTPFDPTPEEIDFAATTDDFRTGIRVDPILDSSVGHLVVRGPSPQVAEIANTLIDTYLEVRRTRHIEEATGAYGALTGEVELSRRALEELENRREEYYDENSLLLEFEKDKVEIGKWLELKAVNVQEEALIASMEKNLAEVINQLAAEEKEIVSSRVFTQNALRETMKTQKFAFDTSLQENLQRYRPDSPEITDLQEIIEAIDGMIGAEDEKVEQATTRVPSETYEQLRQRRQSLLSGLAGAHASLEVKRKAAAELLQRIEQIPEKMTTARALSREQSILARKYMLLLEKQMMAGLFLATADEAPSSMKVVTYARPPAKPIWPNKKLLLGLAGVLGLCAGVGLAVLLDTLRGRVTRDRLSQVRADMPIYATLDLGRRQAGVLGSSSHLGWVGGDGKRRGATVRDQN